MSDPLLNSLAGPWLYDVSSAYQQLPITDFSNVTTGYARVAEITDVTAECTLVDIYDTVVKPYRTLSLRCRIWEFLPYIGQGCVLFDVTISMKRRHQPSPAGAYQSSKYASENVRLLVNEFFRSDSGGLFVQPGMQWSFADWDTACPT